MDICFKKPASVAFAPIRSTIGAAGLDLRSPFFDMIPPKDRKLIDLSIEIVIPKGYYGRLAPRSGLSMKNIDVAAGVIDYDYRGNIKVVLVNHNNFPFMIRRGDKICQIIFEKILEPNKIIEIFETDSTERGDKGFGSTEN